MLLGILIVRTALSPIEGLKPPESIEKSRQGNVRTALSPIEGLKLSNPDAANNNCCVRTALSPIEGLKLNAIPVALSRSVKSEQR